MTCEQGLLRLLWGGGRSWSATALYSRLPCKKTMLHIFFFCCELIGEGTRIDFCSFSTKIGEVTDEFNRRFADFDLLKTKLELFSNLIKVDIESQASCFQLELCQVQANPFLLSKKNERYDVFWKLVSKDQFPCLRDFALKMCSMFW